MRLGRRHGVGGQCSTPPAQAQTPDATAKAARRWALAHWRPAFEAAAAAGYAGASLALGGLAVMSAAGSLFARSAPFLSGGSFGAGPILWGALCAAAGAAAATRWRAAKTIWRARAKLLGAPAVFMTYADLADRLRVLAEDSSSGAQLPPIERSGASAGDVLAAAAGSDGVVYDSRRMPPPKGLWAGLGFPWRSAEAQKLAMLPSEDYRAVLPPDWARRFVLGEAAAEGLPAGAQGSPVIHGVGPREAPIDIPFSQMGAGMLIVGTTQSGKGVVLGGLVSQAILRGDCVIVIDPKFSTRLWRAVQGACRAAGRPQPLLFHPAKPDESVRLDPLGDFQRPTEIASRLKTIIGEAAGEFADLSWAAAHVIVEALLFLGRRPTLAAIDAVLRSGLDPVIDDVLARAFVLGGRRDWRAVMLARRETLLGMQAAESAARKSAGRGPAPWSVKDAERFVLGEMWQEAKADRRFRAAAGAEAVKLVDKLLAECDPQQRALTLKVTGSLRTVLTKLTAGELRSLLSPEPDDAVNPDPRPVATLSKVVKGGLVLYAGLDALTDATIAEAVGMLLLAGLASLAGELYNEGRSGARAATVSLFVDETANVINRPLVELLNKGREAGIQTTCAMQTTADLEAMLGSRAKAMQALGNLNACLALRTIDPGTQQFVADLFGRTLAESTSSTRSLSRESGAWGVIRSTAGASAAGTEAPLVDASRLKDLPNGEFFLSAGGRLYKGRAPILDPDGAERRLADAWPCPDAPKTILRRRKE